MGHGAAAARLDGDEVGRIFREESGRSLAGRCRNRAQRPIWRLVASPRNSARSSSGAPTISALSWLMALTLATQALWRVASSTRNASWSPRRRGVSRWSWASASRAARTASKASDLAPLRRCAAGAAWAAWADRP